MRDSLPEIKENAARGEIATLFADIRRSLAVENVNLIYRHFAAIDGALPTVWALLRPYFVNGEIATAAQDSFENYRLGDNITLSLGAAQLKRLEKSEITRILDFYLTTNPMNLHALEILRFALSEAWHGNGYESPLIPIGDLSVSARNTHFDSLVEELMFLVSQGAPGVRPTLLRQLQAWPELIRTIFPAVKSWCLDERFAVRANEIRNAASARTVAIFKPPQISLPTQALSQVAEFCEYFPVALIRMSLVAQALRQAI